MCTTLVEKADIDKHICFKVKCSNKHIYLQYKLRTIYYSSWLLRQLQEWNQWTTSFLQLGWEKQVKQKKVKVMNYYLTWSKNTRMWSGHILLKKRTIQHIFIKQMFISKQCLPLFFNQPRPNKCTIFWHDIGLGSIFYFLYKSYHSGIYDISYLK